MRHRSTWNIPRGWPWIWKRPDRTALAPPWSRFHVEHAGGFAICILMNRSFAPGPRSSRVGERVGVSRRVGGCRVGGRGAVSSWRTIGSLALDVESHLDDRWTSGWGVARCNGTTFRSSRARGSTGVIRRSPDACCGDRGNRDRFRLGQGRSGDTDVAEARRRDSCGRNRWLTRDASLHRRHGPVRRWLMCVPRGTPRDVDGGARMP